jgi:hypothetical protein
MRMHRAWLLVIALLLALVIGPPVRAHQAAEGALGRYPVPGVVGMSGSKSRCIRSLELRPRLMQRQRSATIEARIRIEAHPDHRAFALSFTSDVDASGGVLRELNNVPGELSPESQDVTPLRDMPGGHYFFTLSVYDAAGKVLDRRTAEIRTADDEPWKDGQRESWMSRLAGAAVVAVATGLHMLVQGPQ